jgi:filamentous hemagglutinin
VGGLDDLAAKAADNVQFGQQSVSRTFTTAENGSTFKYVGQRVSDVASRLRSGSISPDELPIEFVVRDGQNIAVNNRSLLALRRAGHDPTVMIDRTGDALIEARTTERLAEMGGAASDTIRVRGAGSNASYLDWLS